VGKGRVWRQEAREADRPLDTCSLSLASACFREVSWRPRHGDAIATYASGCWRVDMIRKAERPGD